MQSFVLQVPHKSYIKQGLIMPGCISIMLIRAFIHLIRLIYLYNLPQVEQLTSWMENEWMRFVPVKHCISQKGNTERERADKSVIHS